MKFINSIFFFFFSITLTSKLFLLIKSIYIYIKDYNTVSEIFYGDGFKRMLKKYINIDVQKDWIGRLYGIINPNIDIEGNFNINNIVMEFDDNLSNNNEYVAHWLHKQLLLMEELFSLNNFYNYISLEITPVGPVIGDNYLIIFDIASRKNISKYFNQSILQILIYAIIAALIFFVIL